MLKIQYDNQGRIQEFVQGEGTLFIFSTGGSQASIGT